MAINLSDGRVLEGIHRLSLPLPFHPRVVYCYLIESERTTLIDCGLNMPGAFERLREEMAACGMSVEDIDLLIVTHAHLDHYGLAGRVKAESGKRTRGKRYRVEDNSGQKTIRAGMSMAIPIPASNRLDPWMATGKISRGNTTFLT